MMIILESSAAAAPHSPMNGDTRIVEEGNQQDGRASGEISHISFQTTGSRQPSGRFCCGLSCPCATRIANRVTQPSTPSYPTSNAVHAFHGGDAYAIPGSRLLVGPKITSKWYHMCVSIHQRDPTLLDYMKDLTLPPERRPQIPSGRKEDCWSMGAQGLRVGKTALVRAMKCEIRPLVDFDIQFLTGRRTLKNRTLSLTPSVFSMHVMHISSVTKA